MSTNAKQKHRLAGLGSARLFWVLLGLHAVLILGLAVLMHKAITPDDRYTYLGLAEGMQHGRYSFWYFLPDYIPDTFRNPGYPVFLYLLELVGIGELGTYLVQAALYIALLAMLLRLMSHLEAKNEQSWLVRNLFLLLLIPNVHLLYVCFYIYPEMLHAFFLAAFGVTALTLPVGSWWRAVALGLLGGLVFQVRPVFVLLPLGLLALDYWRTRRTGAFSWAQAVTLLVVFGATMLPYAAWNHRHHGVWKVTSLEGGAGVMQIGFWALRMPGYTEQRYWGNVMGDEVISFADPAAIPGYVAAFNHEWDIVEAQCRPLLTPRDLHNLALMRQNSWSGTYPTYNSAYTLRREQELMKANLANIRREPGYYLKTRLYTLVRLWITGVQRPAWRAATSPVAKLKVLLPTLISGITFALGLLGVGWGLLHQRQLRQVAAAWWLALLIVVYYSVVHLPFAIQARYTLPARPWLLLLIALSGAAWLRRREAVPTAAER